MNKNVIIVKSKNGYECWGSLVEVCSVKDLPYHTLKKKKYPFKWNGLDFIRVPFRLSNV